MSENRKAFRRTLREFGVIVLGVLVALWIDASWAWLQDRGEEADLLEDLSSDFAANLVELDRVILAHETASADIGRLLHGSIADLPDDSLVAFIQSVTQLQTFNARDGALEGALSSGRIELLRDRELRTALTRWPGYLSDATESIEWIMPIVMEQSARFAFDLQRLEYASSVERSALLARALVEEMAADTPYRDQLALKAVLWEVEREEERALREETARIVALLEGG